MYMNGGKLIGHTLLVSTQIYISVQLHLLHISRVFIKKKFHSIFSCPSVKVTGEHLTIWLVGENLINSSSLPHCHLCCNVPILLLFPQSNFRQAAALLAIKCNLNIFRFACEMSLQKMWRGMQRIKLPAGCLFGSCCATLDCEDFISEIPLIHLTNLRKKEFTIGPRIPRIL